MTTTRKTIRTIPQQRTPIGEQDADVRIHNFLEVALGYTVEQALNEAERCLDCTDPTCITGCPVSIDIPAFIRRITDGDARGAYEIVAEANFLPAICGRVCPQEEQCEQLCTVGESLEPVAIGRLERWVGDLGIEHGWSGPVPAAGAAAAGRRVAIVGSGPAGMACAADLARAGCEVVVYEALHAPGGVLRYGIPEFRLPNRVIDAEIAKLRALGVQFECNTLVGRLFTLDQMLTEMGFDAVFVATGAGSPRFMGIPGESLNGVISANELLTRANLLGAADPDHDTPLGLGRRVAVIGAGNTAMDALRVSKRLGAEVACVYRRTRAEAPARAEELHHAEQEGIEFHWLTAPVEILDDGAGSVAALRGQRMELGEPDDSGRRRPVPVAGSEVTLDVDTVVYAIGTNANPIIGTTNPVHLNRWGYIDTDRSLATSMAGVFAGGDIVSGAATVILAMGAGRRAARSITAHLGLLDPAVVTDPVSDHADGPFSIPFGQHDGTGLRTARTGRAAAAGLRPVGLGRLSDPVAFRHDYPLLVDGDTGEVATLTERVNQALRAVSEPGPAGDAERRAVLELEAAIRRSVDVEGVVPLRDGWEHATGSLLGSRPAPEASALATTLDAARRSLGRRGTLVGYGAHTGPEIIAHLWARQAAATERHWRSRLAPLATRLRDLLEVDRRADTDGSPEQLHSTLAGGFAGDVDVDRLAGLIAGKAHHPSLDQARRERIAAALDVLADDPRATSRAADPHHDPLDRPVPSRRFESASEALADLRRQTTALLGLVFAVRSAQLEASHRGDDDRYRHLAGRLGAGLLTDDEYALSTPTLVTLDEAALDLEEHDAVLSLLSGRAPVTIVVSCADVVGVDPLGAGPALASPAVRLGRAAMGLGTATVAMVPLARLGRMIPDLERALARGLPTLVVVHDGTGGPSSRDLGPYLSSAAAAECRLFPAIVSIPGEDGEATATLTGATPQPTDDWAVHHVELAGVDGQRVTLDTPFRPSDLLAGDARFDAGVEPPRAPDPDGHDAADPAARWLVDDEGHVLVAHVGEALRELDAAVLRSWRTARGPASARPADDPAAHPAAGHTAEGALPAAPAPMSATPPDDGGPWVNTPRCSSCGECVERFPAAFAYDQDNKAVLTDASALGYAELVAAAEACQVAVIHPGLPADPTDPALAELVARAQPFNR